MAISVSTVFIDWVLMMRDSFTLKGGLVSNIVHNWKPNNIDTIDIVKTFTAPENKGF